jgi:hypothetical protein
MRPQVLIVLLFLLAPLAGCLGSGSVQDVEAPAWRPGYAWSWNTTGEIREAVHYEAQGEEGVQQAEVRKIDPVRETVEVLNTTMEFDGTAVYVVGHWDSESGGMAQTCIEVAATTGGNASSGTQANCIESRQNVRLMAVRQADLVNVPLSYGQSRECQGDNVCRYRIESIHPSGAVAEHPYLDFPLESGKQWGGPLADGPTGDGELEWAYEARVVGSGSVRTQQGEVNTVRVEIIKRPLNIEQWKDELRKQVEDGGDRVDELEYDVAWRQVVHYAPELQTVVRIDFLFEEDVTAAGTDDGQSFRFEQRVSRQFVTLLTGAQLFTKPERDLDYMARVIGGQIPLADPSGNLPDPRRVDITIDPSQPDVNAGDDASAAFNATITDSTGNLTGLRVRWNVLDYQYRSVADGTGTSFSHDFAQPGLYSVQAEAVDEEGRVLASTQVPFEAYYQTVWQDSQPVGLMFFTDGQRVPFPMIPGVESLDIVAEPQGPGAQFNQNRLLVFDAAGNSLPVMNNREVHMTDFADAFVTEDPWTFQWQVNGVSVADDVQVEVVVRYTNQATAEEASGSVAPRLPAALQDLVRTSEEPASGVFA